MNYIKTFFFTILIFLGVSVFSQNNDSRKNEAYTYGENFKYRVYYHSMITGKVTAGIATLNIASKPVKVSGRNTLHVEAIGKSKGLFNMFYKVHDRFETFIDEDSLVPLKFIRRTHEGGYIVNDDVIFDHINLVATSRQETKKIEPNTQDIISAFYFARTLDFTGLKAGQNFPLVFYLDDSVYTSVIQYIGKEIIEIELGKFKCMKFKPMVVKGEAFDDPYPMTLWISDDKNRVPLLVESEIVIGSVKMELLKHSGLRNTLSSEVKK